MRVRSLDDSFGIGLWQLGGASFPGGNAVINKTKEKFGATPVSFLGWGSNKEENFCGARFNFLGGYACIKSDTRKHSIACFCVCGRSKFSAVRVQLSKRKVKEGVEA